MPTTFPPGAGVGPRTRRIAKCSVRRITELREIGDRYAHSVERVGCPEGVWVQRGDNRWDKLCGGANEDVSEVDMR